MKKIRFYIFLFFLLIPTFANAITGTATGKVDSIYTYSTGQVLFTGFVFTGASCNNNGGFYVPANHPHPDRFISMLLTAKAMQPTVTVIAKIDNCWYLEITQSGETTYFYFK